METIGLVTLLTVLYFIILVGVTLLMAIICGKIIYRDKKRIYVYSLLVSILGTCIISALAVIYGYILSGILGG